MTRSKNQTRLPKTPDLWEVLESFWRSSWIQGDENFESFESLENLRHLCQTWSPPYPTKWGPYIGTPTRSTLQLLGLRPPEASLPYVCQSWNILPTSQWICIDVRSVSPPTLTVFNHWFKNVLHVKFFYIRQNLWDTRYWNSPVIVLWNCQSPLLHIPGCGSVSLASCTPSSRLVSNPSVISLWPWDVGPGLDPRNKTCTGSAGPTWECRSINPSYQCVLGHLPCEHVVFSFRPMSSNVSSVHNKVPWPVVIPSSDIWFKSITSCPSVCSVDVTTVPPVVSFLVMRSFPENKKHFGSVKLRIDSRVPKQRPISVRLSLSRQIPKCCPRFISTSVFIHMTIL